MTLPQKLAVTAVVAVAAGLCVYEIGQASRVRRELEAAQNEQLMLSRQVAGLQQALNDAKAQARRTGTRLPAQRAPVVAAVPAATLHEDPAEVMPPDAAATHAPPKELTDEEVRVRADEAWAKLAKRPEMMIPELSMLQWTDWLDLMRPGAFAWETNDDEARRLFAHLRYRAKEQFARELLKGFERYAWDNDGELPTDLEQLFPRYLPKEVDPATFARYRLVASGKLADAQDVTASGEIRARILVEEQAAPVDPDHDVRISLSSEATQLVELRGFYDPDPAQ